MSIWSTPKNPENHAKQIDRYVAKLRTSEKRRLNMENFNFLFVIDGLDAAADDLEARLYEAGCSDALIGVRKGVVTLDFDREAKNFAQALVSAIDDVRRAGGKVVSVEPDPLVTLSDIAARAELSKQAISHYINAERGPGGFPAPSRRVSTDSPLWEWMEVAHWLYKNTDRWSTARPVVYAKLINWVNDRLSQRNGRGGLCISNYSASSPYAYERRDDYS